MEESLMPGPPPASTVAARKRMELQARAGTRPERALSELLRGRGVAFSTGHKLFPGLRRTADIVIDDAWVAVFVDGCFWHGCPEHGTWPQANAQFWREKIEANCRRDRDTDARAHDEGWTVIHVWEHEEPATAVARIVDALPPARLRDSPGGDKSPGLGLIAADQA
jgi:DNA mismatch endonuclease (patch repair protein)